jgi:hypothetical protein
MAFVDVLLDDVRELAEASRMVDLRLGAFFTIAVVETQTGRRAGLAATLGAGEHRHGENLPLPEAGILLDQDPLIVAEHIHAESTFQAAVGLATINALLTVDEERSTEINARNLILEKGAGRRVAMVGHFPFVPAVREAVGTLDVLELNPQGKDRPADDAPKVIPQADIVAITGTTLLNHTFDDLISLCDPDAYVLVLGGSTPLTPRFFSTGVDIVAGTRVGDIEGALLAVSQGAGFRQIPGKRLLVLSREENPG